MRKNIVVGNWKMNLDKESAIKLVKMVLNILPEDNYTEIIFAPSYVHLSEVAKISKKYNRISVASQNCSSNLKGPYTGDVSANMIVSYGAKYTIIGHSERRINFGESNQILSDKVDQALLSNLSVIFCCGESIDQRESGCYFDYIETQITEGLFHLSTNDLEAIVIAYEPIWAIGTGMTANIYQAQEIHEFIRELVSKKYGKKASESISILYGGSCNSSNAKELFAQKDIDGGLIGGASLDAVNFVEITQSF